MSKMRGILEVEVSSRRHHALQEAFPITEGRTQDIVLDSISMEEAAKLEQEWHRNFSGLRVACEMKTKRYLTEVLVNRMFGEPGHQVKATRIILDLLKFLGFSMEERVTRESYERLQNMTMSRFTRKGVEYQIRWDVDSFDRLGSIHHVDSFGSLRPSCYNPDGTVWPDAPVALAAGFGKDVPTYVVFCYQNGEPVGRCWGFLWERGTRGFILTNGYYAPRGITRDISTFVRCLEDSCGDALKYHPVYPGGNIPLSINTDCVRAYSADMDDIRDYYLLDDIDFTSRTCHSCGERHSFESFKTPHLFCPKCIFPGRKVCEQCGTVESDTRSVFQCHHCEVILCERCMMTSNHTHCQKCGVYTCARASSGLPWAYVPGHGRYCIDCSKVLVTCDRCGDNVDPEYNDHNRDCYIPF